VDLQNDYEILYQKYKESYLKDPQQYEKQRLSLSVADILEYDRASVRWRAFLEKDQELYTDTLAPFEYLLFDTFAKEDFKKYKELVHVYRDEYFSYSKRSVSYEFILGATQSDEEQLAQQIVLEGDLTPLELLQGEIQAQLDKLDKNSRKEEKQLLNAYEKKCNTVFMHIQRYTTMLQKLLSDYTPLLYTKQTYMPKTHFQNTFDLLDKDELALYIQESPNLNTSADIKYIRALIQNKVFHNNIQAEQKIQNIAHSQKRELLLQYAVQEQEILSLYEVLVSTYMAKSGIKLDFLEVNAPFELYFDNYFADFNKKTEYYKRYYVGRKEDIVDTPYYIKMHTATEEKLVIEAYNYEEMLQTKREAYINDRYAFGELVHLKEEYILEAESLIDEFLKYGAIYIKEIHENEKDMKQHKENVQRFRTKFLAGKTDGLV